MIEITRPGVRESIARTKDRKLAAGLIAAIFGGPFAPIAILASESESQERFQRTAESKNRQ